MWSGQFLMAPDKIGRLLIQVDLNDPDGPYIPKALRNSLAMLDR